jgi:hypothetical protein
MARAAASLQPRVCTCTQHNSGSKDGFPQGHRRMRAPGLNKNPNPVSLLFEEWAYGTMKRIKIYWKLSTLNDVDC